MTDEYWFTAFGEELAKTGTTVNEFKYVGEQWDPNAGFYYLRARWYSPEEGRLTSIDPYNGDQKSPLTLHLYLYAKSNPISYSDPSGKFIFDLATANLAVDMYGTVGKDVQVAYVSGSSNPLIITVYNEGAFGDADPEKFGFRHFRIKFDAIILGKKNGCEIFQEKKIIKSSYANGVIQDPPSDHFVPDGGIWWNGVEWNKIIKDDAAWINGNHAVFFDYPGIDNLNKFAFAAERTIQYRTVIRDINNHSKMKEIFWGFEMSIDAPGSSIEYFFTGNRY